MTKDKKMKPLLLDWQDKSALQKLSESIKKNNLVLGTTDTVLGLFAPTTFEGFQKLNKAKGRFEKPYLILIGSLDRINYYSDFKNSFQIEKIMKRFWPGPLTIIFKANSDVPQYIQSEQGTVALRIPDHKGIRSLLALSGDLFSTSANLTNEPIPETLEAVDPLVLGAVEYYVGGGASSTVPSTILDCSNLHTIKIIREGAITKEALELV